MTSRAADCDSIISFWENAGPAAWFTKDDEFDRRFKSEFLATYELATRGELAHWSSTPRGALALVLLLDQFPRNAFRGTSHMFEADAMALEIASTAINAGFDQEVSADLRLFFYLPFEHSENLADQDRAVELIRPLGERLLDYAEKHREVIRRFGRFPHRNHVLGRAMQEEEQVYLDRGGESW